MIEDIERYNKLLASNKEKIASEALEAEFKIISILQKMRENTGVENIDINITNGRVSVEVSIDEVKRITKDTLNKKD